MNRLENSMKNEINNKYKDFKENYKTVSLSLLQRLNLNILIFSSDKKITLKSDNKLVNRLNEQ